MGYYVRFALDVMDNQQLRSAAPARVRCQGHEEIVRQLHEESEDARSAFKENGRPIEPLKWYDHEEDLKAFSLKHPNLLFKLSGEGEEAEDLWDKYFQNGKMMVCKAVITKPPFDPSKLK